MQLWADEKSNEVYNRFKVYRLDIAEMTSGFLRNIQIFFTINVFDISERK